MRRGGDEADTLGTRLNNALSPRNLVAGFGLTLGIQQVTSFIGDAIQSASNLNETITKTGVILGEEALPGLRAWAQGAADAFGQSEQQALDAAATFAIFGKSADLTGQDLVAFSTDLTELSGDFASFFNTSPEEAIMAIGAALRGESEPIRRYGVLLDEATLRQRAFTMGIIDTTTQALTPQQRVLAAHQEILAQTGDAQGDFQRTSEGLANQQRILSANLANVSAEIGEKLIPVMLELANFANEVLVPALQSIVDNAKLIGEVLAGVWGAVGGASGQMAEFGARVSQAEALRDNVTRVAGMAPGAGGGGGGTTININAPTVPLTPRDIGRELRRTGAFAD